MDAGHGWLIFALPPTEAAFHPSEDDAHDLYFMCYDLKAEMASLAKKIARKRQKLITKLQLRQREKQFCWK